MCDVNCETSVTPKTDRMHAFRSSSQRPCTFRAVSGDESVKNTAFPMRSRYNHSNWHLATRTYLTPAFAVHPIVFLQQVPQIDCAPVCTAGKPLQTLNFPTPTFSLFRLERGRPALVNRLHRSFDTQEISAYGRQCQWRYANPLDPP